MTWFQTIDDLTNSKILTEDAGDAIFEQLSHMEKWDIPIPQICAVPTSVSGEDGPQIWRDRVSLEWEGEDHLGPWAVSLVLNANGTVHDFNHYHLNATASDVSVASRKTYPFQESLIMLRRWIPSQG